MSRHRSVSAATSVPGTGVIVAQNHQTFSSIIEADHSTINRCAGRLRKALVSLSTSSAKPLSEVFAIRDEVIWRLIRHDVSEEIVMRPAFIEYMGDEGRKIVDNDRKDHGDAKNELLKLQKIPLHSPAYIEFVTHLMSELAEHMKRESGLEIPRLETHLSRAQSLQLANEYARTQLLTPDICWPPRKTDDDGGSGGSGARVFETLQDYVLADMSIFRRVLDALPPLSQNSQEGKASPQLLSNTETVSGHQRKVSHL